MRTDEDLLLSWAGGDKASGDALFGRHVEAIFRFFDRRAASEAEELVQATFLGALEARGRFRGEAPFRAFLFGIARRQLLKHFEKRRGADRISFRTMSMADLGTSALSAVARDRNRQRLMHAMNELPVDHQLALELHYWEGLTTREVGEALECPPGTVKRWLFEARQRLGARLELVAGELEAQPPDDAGSP